MPVSRKRNGDERIPAAALSKKLSEKSMTLRDLAKATGISVRTLEEYSQGRSYINKCPAELICKISEALECEVEEILEPFEGA